MLRNLSFHLVELLVCIFVLSECLEKHAAAHQSQNYEFDSERTSRQLVTSIQRVRGSRLTRPSRTDADMYSSNSNESRLQRVSTDEQSSISQLSQLSFEFLIAGDKESSELQNCCRDQIEEGIQTTLHDIDGLNLDTNQDSSSILMFTNIVECNSSPKYFTSIRYMSQIIPGVDHDTNTMSQFLEHITNAIENGNLHMNIVRSGLSQQHEVMQVLEDDNTPFHVLCGYNTAHPSFMPTAVFSDSPSISPTIKPISLLFQVGLVGGRTSQEFSECCREQILGGAKDSVTRIFSGLSGRRRKLQERTSKSAKSPKSPKYDPILLECYLSSVSIVKMADYQAGIVDVLYDIKFYSNGTSAESIVVQTLDDALDDNVERGEFTESLKLQGLTDVEAVTASNTPSASPSLSVLPSVIPNTNPTLQPTIISTNTPSYDPTHNPSEFPTGTPSEKPSYLPSNKPSHSPSIESSLTPSLQLSTYPSSKPSHNPSANPSYLPSNKPSYSPSVKPSSTPSLQPSTYPSSKPSYSPSVKPSSTPSLQPSTYPSSKPSHSPSVKPSSTPSLQPSTYPSSEPSHNPSVDPSYLPSNKPSHSPSIKPSSMPSTYPSSTPSSIPSNKPSFISLTYIGCFFDAPERALPFYGGKYIGVNECFISCRNNGFIYAGTQHIGECWCGNSGYDTYGSSNNCNCEGPDIGSYVNCVYKIETHS